MSVRAVRRSDELGVIKTIPTAGKIYCQLTGASSSHQKRRPDHRSLAASWLKQMRSPLGGNSVICHCVEMHSPTEGLPTLTEGCPSLVSTADLFDLTGKLLAGQESKADTTWLSHVQMSQMHLHPRTLCLGFPCFHDLHMSQSHIQTPSVPQVRHAQCHHLGIPCGSSTSSLLCTLTGLTLCRWYLSLSGTWSLCGQSPCF